MKSNLILQRGMKVVKKTHDFTVLSFNICHFHHPWKGGGVSSRELKDVVDMVDDPSGFWMTSGDSPDCTISDVVAGGAQDFFGGLLDPSDEVPAEGGTLSNHVFDHQISVYHNERSRKVEADVAMCPLPSLFSQRRKQSWRGLCALCTTQLLIYSSAFHCFISKLK